MTVIGRPGGTPKQFLNPDLFFGGSGFLYRVTASRDTLLAGFPVYLAGTGTSNVWMTFPSNSRLRIFVLNYFHTICQSLPASYEKNLITGMFSDEAEEEYFFRKVSTYPGGTICADRTFHSGEKVLSPVYRMDKAQKIGFTFSLETVESGAGSVSNCSGDQASISAYVFSDTEAGTLNPAAYADIELLREI